MSFDQDSISMVMKDRNIRGNHDITQLETLQVTITQSCCHEYLIEREDFSKDRLKSILEKDKISESIIEDFIDIINNCELARYTPTTPEGMDHDYEKAVKVISNFDKR